MYNNLFTSKVDSVVFQSQISSTTKLYRHISLLLWRYLRAVVLQLL